MTPAIRKRLVQIGFLFLIQAVALFASVWKWNWWNAWVYLGEYLVFLVFNLFVRTVMEDRTPQNELDGYKEYTGRLRYRLIPGIW